MSTHSTTETADSVQETMQARTKMVSGLISSLTRKNLGRGSLNRSLLTWACIACIPGLILGLAAFASSVGPLEQRLLELEAHGLARDIDSVVKVRLAAIRIAAEGIDRERLSEAGSLDTLLKTFRRSFRDFLSLEILDKRGEVLAMAGELPLSHARRFSGSDRADGPGNIALTRSEVFQDDPKAKDFFITVRHKAQDGTTWYSRTRFSRDPIEIVLSSRGGQWQARIVEDSNQDPKPRGDHTTTTPSLGTWWRSSDTVEVPLQTHGWTLKLEKPSKQTFLTVVPFVVVPLLALVAIWACLHRRYGSGGRMQLPGAAVLAAPQCSSRDFWPEGATETPRSFDVGSCARTYLHERSGEEEADHDVWTPRNVPMGIRILPEPDESGSERVLSPVTPDRGEHEERTAQSPETDGPSPLDEHMSDGPEHPWVESDTRDIPDTIHLTWYEPPQCEEHDEVGAPHPHTFSTIPEAETRRVALPEIPEVARSKPERGTPDDLDDDRAEHRPTTYFTA